MSAALILAAIDAGSTLLIKLIAAYSAMPDADPAVKDALAAQVTELDKTAAVVAAWQAVPIQSDPPTGDPAA